MDRKRLLIGTFGAQGIQKGRQALAARCRGAKAQADTLERQV